MGTSKAHGAPLGEDEVRATKELLGWDPDEQFVVPDEVREHFDQTERGAAFHADWNERFEHWRGQDFADGQDHGVETCADDLQALLDGNP